MNHPLVVAITGASGVIYATRLLEILAGQGIDVHLTISESGRTVLSHELNLDIDLHRFEIQQLLPRVDLSRSEFSYHH